MKNTKLILGLALALSLTSCNSTKTPANPVSEETITAALDGEVSESEKINQELKPSEEDTVEETNPDEIDYEKWRNMIVEIGEFSETVANNLTDEQIDELVTRARELSEETGYWDVKDFVFQELGETYPELSYKFPLESIDTKLNQTAAVEGELTDKYDYERRVMADWGYPSDLVWSIDDKTIEDAFHKAYEADEEAYYEDYLDKVSEIIFESDDEDDEDSTEESSESTTETNSSPKTKLRRFGSSQIDYDALKSSLVQYYEFSPSTVNQITNDDIDIAYTRAMDRLEQKGFGDIGLIFEELGKMYPGASTMYPGE